MSSNIVNLVHPNGTHVVLIGTKHVSCLDGDKVASAVSQYHPETVVLEVDQDRYQQLYFRLAHLLQHDTAALMALTAGRDVEPAHQHDSSNCEQQPPNDVHSDAQGSSWQRLLHYMIPDALLWRPHHQQFQLMRNEGVPLLIGSLYGADMLQASLAASAANTAAAAANATFHQTAATAADSNARPIQIVLADQSQDVTMQRFRALADGLGQLQQLLAGLLTPAGVAHAEAITCLTNSSSTTLDTLNASPSSSSSSSSSNLTRQQSTISSIFSAAVELAASRLFHLFLQWWTMALSSSSNWYGNNLHPIFWLAGNETMQQQLEDAGVHCVRPAAAAVVRLLHCAAKCSSSSSSSVCMPDADDIAVVRKCVRSMEEVGWARQDDVTNSSSSSSSSGGSNIADGISSSTASLAVQPWWQSWLGRLKQQQQQQHVNVTAAEAYEQAVMVERNALLADALWDCADAAASSSSSSSSGASSWWGNASPAGNALPAAPAAVLGVVGVNHLPGVVQEWNKRCQQQQQQQQQYVRSLDLKASSSSDVTAWVQTPAASVTNSVSPNISNVTNISSSSSNGALCWQQQQQQHAQVRFSSKLQGMSSTQLTVTDLLADTLELCAVGSAGLGYWWAVKRCCQQQQYPSSSSSSSSSTRLAFSSWQRALPSYTRVGLLLLPVAVALLPLQRDASRFQESGVFLSRVAAVNDQMLRQGYGNDNAEGMLRLAGVLK